MLKVANQKVITLKPHIVPKRFSTFNSVVFHENLSTATQMYFLALPTWGRICTVLKVQPFEKDKKCLLKCAIYRPWAAIL